MRKLKLKPEYKKPLIISISILCVVLFSAFLIPSNTTVEEPIYYVGIIESEKSEKLSIMKAYEAYLKNRNLEIPNIEYTYYTSGTKLLEAMNQGMVDIGFIDAYSLVKDDLNESMMVIASKNITVSSEEPQNYYRSLLLRRVYVDDDEITSRDVDYSKLTYCVLSPNSVAGYLGIMPFFEALDINFYDLESIKVDSFEDSLVNLASNTCDIGVGYTNIREEYEDIWELYKGAKGSIYDELSIIYVSEKLYDDAVVISEKIDDTFKEQFLELLFKNNYSESSNENYNYLKDSITRYLGGK